MEKGLGCISVSSSQFNCRTFQPPSKGGCRISIHAGDSDNEFEVREMP
jgi:hypothetical protein